MVTKKNYVILFAGEEEFLKEQELNRIKSELFKQSEVSLNYDLFYAREADGEKIVECLSTQPLLSPCRLVVIKDVEQLSDFNKQLLLNYCRRPLQSSRLILETRQKNIKRDKFLNSLSQYTQVIFFRPLTNERLSRWITERLKSESKKVGDNALELLKENASGGLESLARLLENLVVYAGGREEIVLEDVKKAIGGDINEDAFSFTAALGEKDFSRAIGILAGLFRKGEEPLRILGLIFWHLRRVNKARQMLANGNSKEKLQRELKINPYFWDGFIRQVNSFSVEALKGAFRILLEADSNIKNGRLKPKLALELAVVRLCG